jgi:hypothetical protein
MNRHPSDETLLRHCESADSPAAEQVRRHLEAGCERCSDRIAGMRQILAALRSTQLTIAPGALVRAALEAITERERLISQSVATPVESRAGKKVGDRVKAKARELLEEIRLGLVLDTAAGMVMQGIRGSATSELRQLLFESPLGTLHVQIETHPGSFSLVGQFVILTPPDRPGRTSVLVERDGGSLRGRLSDTGEFRLDGIASGRVRVRIEWDGRAFVSDSIDLEAGLDG